MNIATVSLTTRLRTRLLFAGLTALLVAIGTVIGGGFLSIFVALAVLMNLAGYWFSDRIALAASHARPLPEHEAPELHRIVGELAGRAGVPMPRVSLVPSEQPNAFATAATLPMRPLPWPPRASAACAATTASHSRHLRRDRRTTG